MKEEYGSQVKRHVIQDKGKFSSLGSPMKGLMRFDKRGKLSPLYIGPFQIFKLVELVAYRFALALNYS